MAFRLQVVPGHEPPDLLDLPWSAPLCEWDHPRLIRMAQGVSRHVVRIVSDRERAYALKETAEDDARREYAMLRLIAAENLPVVEAVGLITGRRTPGDEPLDAVLVTRYLDFSLPYRYLFGVEGGPYLGKRLVDAAVVLLVRIHSEGFYWGDCSLSNLLFRRDAGALMAYLVDAETTERRVPMSSGMREADVELARENFAGGLLDLAAEGQLSGDIDVISLADLVEERYHLLWEELTGTLEINMADRHLIDQRLRRLNDLGFDVDELIVENEVDGSGGDRLRVTPALVEEGHHSRELRRLTGLEVQENQARRLLNDITAFGAYLSRIEDRTIPQAVVAARWIAEVYEPIIEKVPPELRGRLEPPELFHQLLEHRYYLSEEIGHEVDNETALLSFLESVLRFRREERVLLTDKGEETDRAEGPQRS
ncbi:MAG: DUF4032 domain-containing protein [Actinomycetota bacterium]|nr:DUF4032 domain-containing protein [Actinomycetota bacterium]MDQ6947946.1 DUF4032 domain-containing protein [Actinomycetota bacterium]